MANWSIDCVRMRRSRGSIWTSSRERQITSNLMKPSQKGPACQTRELQNGTSTDKDCIQVHYSRYSKIVQSSTDIANKILISLLDKHFKNFEMLAEALDASCVLSLVDGANAIPRATTSNSSGYSAKSIVSVEDPLLLLVVALGIAFAPSTNDKTHDASNASARDRKSVV